MALAIAGSEGRKCAAMDIGNTYLEADMGTEEVYIELDASTAKMLVKLFPELDSKINEHGKIVARLAKAPYGCVVSVVPVGNVHHSSIVERTSGHRRHNR
jgi:hypothetical protein